MNLMENPNFKFQSDWFSKRIPDWEKFLEHQKGAPNLEYLEVGSFEGRSTVWILANILTHPTSRITCIDTFGGSMEHGRMGLDTTVIEDTFWHNIWVIKVENKVRVLKGKSQEVLRRLPFDTYDFAYIDGSHVASDVLTDAVLTFPLIKRGGIIVFDDYRWEDEEDVLDRPKIGIDAFLEVFSREYDLIKKWGQVVIKKR